MPSYRIVLSPQGGISGLPFSETIFGAICWSIRLLYGEEILENLLENFESSAQRFYVSSAFPCIRQNGGYKYYYPRPFSLPFPRKEGEVSDYKSFQQTAYLSEPLFQRWLGGEQGATLYQRFIQGELNICDNMLQEQEGLLANQRLYKRAVFAGTKLDRLHTSTAGAGELFYFTRLYSDKDVACYFLVDTIDNDFILPAIRLAAERGLGGDRSVGRAAFHVAATEPFTPSIKSGRTFITLSRYLPRQKELDLDDAITAYRLISCRAKVESAFSFHGEDIWKRQVLYLKEGSCLALQEEKPFPGQLPVVKELAGKKIRQYGYAYPAFLKGGIDHAG